MEDAYVIGIRLALDNGVSEGVAAIRGELAALDRAVAASAMQLSALRRVASSALQANSPSSVAVGLESSAVAKPVAIEPEAATPRASAMTPGVMPVTVPTARPPLAVYAPMVTPAPTAPPSPSALPLGAGGATRTDDRAQSAQRVSPPVVAVATVPIPANSARAPLAVPGSAPSMARPARDLMSPAAPSVGAMPAVAKIGETERAVSPRRPPDALPAAGAIPPQRPALVDFAEVGRRIYAVPMSRDVAPEPRVTARKGELSQEVADERGPGIDPVPPRPPLVPPAPQRPSDGLGAARQDVPAAVGPIISNRVAAPPRGFPETGPRQVAMVPSVPAPPSHPVLVAAPTSPRELPSAVPPADSNGSGRLSGDVYLDGARVGRWLTSRMEREANRPPVGPTFFDARQSPAWGGATVGM